jgi:DNA (cytosine-5)-methyltransferase 1
MECVYQVEIDDFATRVLEKHWPAVPRWRDIKDFQGEPAEVICGGFPCKQTSNAAAVHGRRLGLDGEDSGLWFEMLRIVRNVRPRWVVVENTVGAAAWHAEIKGGLAGVGYAVPPQPLELSAEMFGAPHSRRRLFWVADLDGAGLQIARAGGPSATEQKSWRAAPRNTWTQTIPRDLRMDDGIPSPLDRADRIRCLGNTIVPDMSEWIGRRIMAAERQEVRSGP